MPYERNIAFNLRKFDDTDIYPRVILESVLCDSLLSLSFSNYFCMLSLQREYFKWDPIFTYI